MSRPGGWSRILLEITVISLVFCAPAAAQTPTPGQIRLADDIDATEDRIPVTSFYGLSEDGGIITVDPGKDNRERIRYGGLEFGDRLVLVTQRGIEGTTAGPHLAGALIVADASPTPTPTITRTPSISPTPSETRTPTPTRTFRPTATPAKCIGDCDENGEVTVDELVIGVNQALGVDVGQLCDAFEVLAGVPPSVAELIAAVKNSLEGCPSIVPLPDLLATTAGIGSQTPCGDAVPPFILGLCIANLGNAGAANFRVRLNPWGDEFIVDGLLAGQERCFQRTAEQFRGTIVVDSNDSVEELREGNNALPFEFPTRTRLPGCTRTPTPTVIRDTPTPR